MKDSSRKSILASDAFSLTARRIESESVPGPHTVTPMVPSLCSINRVNKLFQSGRPAYAGT